MSLDCVNESMNTALATSFPLSTEYSVPWLRMLVVLSIKIGEALVAGQTSVVLLLWSELTKYTKETLPGVSNSPNTTIFSCAKSRGCYANLLLSVFHLLYMTFSEASWSLAAIIWDNRIAHVLRSLCYYSGMNNKHYTCTNTQYIKWSILEIYYYL